MWVVSALVTQKISSSLCLPLTLSFLITSVRRCLFLVWRTLCAPLAAEQNILFMHIVNSLPLRAYALGTQKPERLERLFLCSVTFLEKMDRNCSNKGKGIGGGKLHCKLRYKNILKPRLLIQQNKTCWLLERTHHRGDASVNECSQTSHRPEMIASHVLFQDGFYDYFFRSGIIVLYCSIPRLFPLNNIL